MPDQERSLSLDMYSVYLGKDVKVEPKESLQGVRSVFKYTTKELEMVIFYGVELEEGVALAGINEADSRIAIFYVYDRYGRLPEVIALGEYLTENTLSVLSSSFEGLAVDKKGIRTVIVDSYETDEEKLSKLLLTDFKITLK